MSKPESFNVKFAFDGNGEVEEEKLPVMDFADHDALAGSGDESDAAPEAVPLVLGKQKALARSKHMMKYEAERRNKKRLANKAHSAAMSARKAANQVSSKNSVRKYVEEGSFAGFGGPNGTFDAPGSSTGTTAEHQDKGPPGPGDDSREHRKSETALDAQRKLTRLTGPLSRPTPELIPKYLPDDVFVKAAASRSAQVLQASEDAKKSTKEKRKVADRVKAVSRKQVKDVILGSRTIRPLPVTQHIGLHLSLQRPQAAREFRSKRLNADGMQDNKRWDRIEPHLARSMRRSGLAPRFAQADRS